MTIRNMMRYLMLVWMYALPMLAGGPTCETLMHHAIAFDGHWNLYVRHLFGCKDSGVTSPMTCDIHQSVVDYGEYLKSRREAMVVFNLGEK